MADKKRSYRELQEELDAVLQQLQASEVDIDAAVQLYERGLKLVASLEAELKTAENTITRLQAK